MEDKSLELLTPEQRKWHDEFTRCQNWEEVEEFLKRWEEYEASREPEEIPHYDMTWDEYCKKYGLVSLEEIEKRMWGK